jgi:signal transduction histidine kinase
LNKITYHIVCIFIISTLIFGYQVFAQNRYLDSLTQLLSLHKEDSLKLIILNQLAFRLSGTNPIQSSQYAREAILLSEKLNLPRETARAYNALAIVARSKSTLDSSLYFLLNALKINEKEQFIHGICQTLNGIGATYSKMGDYPKALESFSKVLEYRKTIFDTIGIANSMGNIGSVYEKVGNWDNAILYHQNAINFHLSMDNKIDASFSYNSLGNIYKEKRQYELSQNAYKEALIIYQRYKNKFGEAETLLNWGSLYYLKNQPDSAKILLDNSLLISKKINANELIIKGLRNLSWVYQKEGNYLKSNILLEQYSTLKDSIYTLEKNKQLEELKTQYEVEKKEKENQRLKNDALFQEVNLQEQKNNILILITLVLLLLGISYVLYRNNQRKKMMNAMLSGFNEELQSQNEKIIIQSEKLQDANKKIAQVNFDLEYQVAERTRALEESNQELDLFLYHASHDLRRPLTSLMGISTIAQMVSQDKEVLQLFDLIEDTAKKMNKMLQKLIMLSEIMNAEEYDNKLIDFEQIIKEIYQKNEESILKKNIQWKVEVESGTSIHLITNEMLLKIALQNIIENSIQFSKPSNSYIKISFSERKDSFIIKIEDNGEGILDSIKHKVFDLYYRGSESSEGNGIGLYLVKKVMEKLKSTLHLESQIGKFTIIEIRFPKYQ